MITIHVLSGGREENLYLKHFLKKIMIYLLDALTTCVTAEFWVVSF